MNSRQTRRGSMFSKACDGPTGGNYGDNTFTAGGLLQNSYKLKPDNKICVKDVRNVVETTLHDCLKDRDYIYEECSKMCTEVSQEIQEKVKRLGIERYKFVTVVYIGEKKGQSARVASRCLWNETYDSYASAHYYGESIFAQATVYGVYLE